MPISPIDEIKEKIDIVDLVSQYVKLKKVGSNYQALCPFHSEKTPSFFVSPSKQIWKCFGCQKGGNVFDFIMEMEGLSFKDALKILAQRAGIELKEVDPYVNKEKKELLDICELATKFFQKQLHESSKGKEALEYLKKRGLKMNTIYEWRIGYAPNLWTALSDFLQNKGFSRLQIEKAGLCIISSDKSYYDRFRSRIMFPVFDVQGRVIGFGGRIFGAAEKSDVAKYMNSPQTILYDKSKVLYGMHKAKVEIKRKNEAILTEGYFDVILSHQLGFENTVGVSGTALTPSHARIIKRYCDKVICAFDMDIAGNKATERSIMILQRLGFDVKVALSDKDKDPADMILEKPEEWRKIIENPLPIAEFYINVAKLNYDKNTLEGKKKMGDFVLPAIKRIQNKIEQAHWIQVLSQEIGVKEEILYEQMKNIRIEDYDIDFSETTDDKSEQTQTNINGVDSNNANKRLNLLENFLVAILYKYPEYLYLIPNFEEKNNQENFLSERVRKFINDLKTNKEKSIENIYKNNVIAEIIRSLPKESEGGFEGFSPEAEINYILKEIKNIRLQEKLKELSSKIAEYEKSNNMELVNKLTEEFNKLVSQII